MPIYSFDEVFEACLEYFHGDRIAAKAAATKYLLRDKDGNFVEKTPNDYLAYRIPNEFYRIEQKYPNPLPLDVIRESLGGIPEEELSANPEKKKQLGYGPVVPQGSPTFGIGNDSKIISLSNCFVLSQPFDSYGGICQIDQQVAQIQKRRGGVGIDLSTLRPRGSNVNNAAITSDGIAVFMDRYSNTTLEVAQNGRRGASLLSLDCRHPDILTFINAKRNLKKVQGANVSVKWHDDFFEALHNNGKYILRFPVDSSVEEAQITQEVNAKDIWDAFIDSTWESAEPGCFYWDTMINQSISDEYVEEGYRTISTNPCIVGSALISTSSGPVRAKDLVGKNFKAIINGNPYNSSGFFETGNKKVFEVMTRHGFSVKVTDNHELIVMENKKQISRRLSDLKIGDVLVLNNQRNFMWNGIGNEKEGWLVGNMVGDGCFCNNEEKQCLLEYWGRGRGKMSVLALSFLRDVLKIRSDAGGKDINGKIRIGSTELAKLSLDFGVGFDKKLSYKIEETSRLFHIGFLRGWFDADGTVIGNHKKGCSVRLSSSILENLYVAQRMLSRIGIISTIYKNRRKEQWKNMPDGKGGEKSYLCKAQHELVISCENINEFCDKIGFLDNHKQMKLKEVISSLKRKPNKESFLSEVISITYCGEEAVYDAQIEGINVFDANGIIIHNCGELGLAANSSCILMLVNLMKFVKRPFLPDAEFDWCSFDKYVKIAVRLIDDLVDLEIEKIKGIINKIEKDPEPEEIKATELDLWNKILKKIEDSRKTGLGVTALGDMLASLGIKYASEDSLKFCDVLFGNFQETVYRESAMLAKERGPFSFWNWKKEKNNYYIKKLSVETQKLIEKYGRRNMANLTLSPAGTTSIVTLTTSGIEPLYRHEMTRRRKMSQDEEKAGIKADSVEESGVKWVHDKVYHRGFLQWKQATGKDCFCDSPYSGSEAYDLDPKFRVKLQGTIQKHIDSSISSTINLPKATTKEQISELYLLGWKEKCKGLTVYREGSRDGVLLTGEKQGDIVESKAPSRPQILDCDIHVSNVKGQKWVFFVGILNNKPYEIFGGKFGTIDIPRKFIKGREINGKPESHIRKNAKNAAGISSYDLILGSGSNAIEFKDISSIFSPDNGTPTRLISMLLRHGVPVNHICEQIRKMPQEDSMLTFEKGIRRVLAKYVADKTEVKGNCPECGSKIIYEGGCVKCSQCPWSRCD